MLSITARKDDGCDGLAEVKVQAPTPTNVNDQAQPPSEPTNDRAQSEAKPYKQAQIWFKRVSQWERLVFYKICAQMDAKEASNPREQQIRKEHHLHQETLISKFKDARQLTAHEIEQNFHNLEKSISTMILRKYERSGLMEAKAKGGAVLKNPRESTDQFIGNMFEWDFVVK